MNRSPNGIRTPEGDNLEKKTYLNTTPVLILLMYTLIRNYSTITQRTHNTL